MSPTYFCKAKVHQYPFTEVRVIKKVSWLNIPMENPMLVNRVKCSEQRPEVMAHIRYHECTVLNAEIAMREKGQYRHDLVQMSKSSD